MRHILSSAFLVAVLLVSTISEARGKQQPQEDNDGGWGHVTYDLGAGSGNYDGANYTEINIGLNWFMTDWFNWRNAIFTRSETGFDTIYGLDSSARFLATTRSQTGTFGIDAFAGPGLRFANQDSNAVFAEAGLIFKLGGLHIGAGVKALNYISDRKDSAGNAFPRTDTETFIILGGSGSLF